MWSPVSSSSSSWSSSFLAPCTLHPRLLVAFGWGECSGESPALLGMPVAGTGPPTWKAGNQLLQHTPAIPPNPSHTSLPGHKRAQCSQGGSQGVLKPAQTPGAREGVSESLPADGLSSSSSTGSHPLSLSQPADLHLSLSPSQTSTAASPLQANPRSCVSPAQHCLAELQPQSLKLQPKNLPQQTHHCYLFYYPALHNLYFCFYYLDWSPAEVYVAMLATLQFLMLTVRKWGRLFPSLSFSQPLFPLGLHWAASVMFSQDQIFCI